MAPTFHTLRISDLRRESVDTISIAFDVPETLKEAYRFTQGQYLTLRTTIEGEDVRRSYSICTGVQDGELRVAIKKIDGGLFSHYAHDHFKTGQTIEVMTPQGRFFTALDAQNRKLYVAFAAGSGITPIFSIIKTTLVAEPQSRFVLIYGNRNFDHIVFREALDLLKNLYPERLAIHHVLSRETLGSDLFHGRIDADKCRHYGRYLFPVQEVDAYFLCGPEEMIFEVKDTLIEFGVNPEVIHFELFTSSGVKKKKVQRPDNLSSFDASVSVIQDGAQFDFNLTSDGSSLLDAAMRAGADLPFACKGGVCSTCKARILEGEVEMEVNYGLEPDEVAAGYVLTCQSHPKTKRVVVTFD